MEKERELEKERKLEKEQIDEDYKTVLATAAGRRLLWHLIVDVCGINKSPTDISNVYNTYYLGGQRQLGEAVKKRIDRIDPMFIFKMARENAKKKK